MVRPVPLGSSWTPPFGVGAPAINGKSSANMAKHGKTWQNINTFASASSASSGVHQSQENVFANFGFACGFTFGFACHFAWCRIFQCLLGLSNIVYVILLFFWLRTAAPRGTEKHKAFETKIGCWSTRHQEVSYECNCSTHPFFAR